VIFEAGAFASPLTLVARLVLAGLAMIAFSSCGTPRTSAPQARPTANRCNLGSPQPFTQTHVTPQDAQRAAARAMHYDGVITVRQGHIGDFEPVASCGTSDTRAVWAVVVYGTFPPGSCGPMRPPGVTPICPAPVHTGVVFVEYATGAWVEAETPAPLSYRPPAGWSPSPYPGG